MKVGEETGEEKLSRAVFNEQVRKAKDYALNLLTYRPRSCQEIRDKLRGKHYPEKVLEKVIARLRELSFLDDKQFARLWVESRLLNKPLGRRLLEQELRQKGIGSEIVEKVCESAYREQGEEEIALELARKRLKRYGNPDDFAVKRRLYGYLGRRGFPPDTISGVLEKLF